VMIQVLKSILLELLSCEGMSRRKNVVRWFQPPANSGAQFRCSYGNHVSSLSKIGNWLQRSSW
jgi:hypothetical protein